MPADTLLDSRPAVRPAVQVSRAYRRGVREVHLVREPAAGKQFEVGPKESFLISRLDGVRSLRALSGEYEQRFGRGLDAAAWQQLLGLLYARGLIGPAAEPSGGVAPRRRTGNAFFGSLALAGPGAFADRFGFLLRRAVWIPLLTLAVAACVAAAAGPALFRDAWAIFERPPLVLAVLAALWSAVVVHELAHAVVARRCGGTVSEIGVFWRFGIVLAYCKVDDLLFLPSRARQVAIAGAGVGVNLLMLGPVAAVWLFAPLGEAARSVLAAIVLAGLAQILICLLPVPPMDGYRMLSSSLGMIRLADESRAFLLSPRRWAHYPRRLRWIFGLYGAGAPALLLTLVAGGAVAVHHLVRALAGDSAVLIADMSIALFLGGVLAAKTVQYSRGGTA